MGPCGPMARNFFRLERVAGGEQTNTAFVECLNLAIGQRVAVVGRRVTTLCKGGDGLRQPVVL